MPCAFSANADPTNAGLAELAPSRQFVGYWPTGALLMVGDFGVL